RQCRGGPPRATARVSRPEGGVRRRALTAVLDRVADRFDEAQVDSGEDTEAHHGHQKAGPGEPSCPRLGRGDLAEEVLALLVDVLDMGDVLVAIDVVDY